MSKRKRSNEQPVRRSSRRTFQNVLQEDSCELFEQHDRIDVAMIPNADNSDIESQSDREGNDDKESEECSDTDEFLDRENNDNINNVLSHMKVYDSYSTGQKYLEEDHRYNWIMGEKKYDKIVKNEYLLKDSDKKMIRNSSRVQLFEIFFSSDMKNHVIEASAENGLILSMEKLNTFVGVLILSSFNKRGAIKDYWSTNPLLECPIVRSAMPRKDFLDVKGKIKFSKQSEQNPNDPAWRVRIIFEMFRQNIKKFGYFQTALSVDEMMVKFFGRLLIKQYIRNKPVRFGIKLWALCGADGFLFDCNIYGGRNDGKDGKLKKIALGSRVVVNLLEDLMKKTVHKKTLQYFLHTDNYFTSPDLFVHLQTMGLKATGVVRKDRIKEKNELSDKASRGTYIIKHDKSSGMNYITLMDSKKVSLLSTAAGESPLTNAKRFSKEQKAKIDIPMPNAFSVYNKYMGGVDLHDQYCSKALPSMRSKKWTFSIFVRLIQSSLSNALIISNFVNEKKQSMKDFAMSVAEHYLSQALLGDMKNHDIEKTQKTKYCSIDKCDKRTTLYCKQCDKYFCRTCSNDFHKN